MSKPTKEEVIKFFRCITSTSKDGLLARQLLSDFKSMNGYPLPLGELGYATVDDLLIRSGQFTLRHTSEGVKFIQKLSEDSAHITQLVQQQQTAKSKKKKGPTMPQRPIRAAGNQQYRRPPNKPTAYTNMYTSNRPTRNTTNNRNALPSLMSLKIDQPAIASAPVPFGRRNGNQDAMRPITKQSNIGEDTASKFNYSAAKVKPPAVSPPPPTQPNGHAHAPNRILHQINQNNMNKQRQVSSSPVNGGANKNFVARPKLDLSQRLAPHKSPADQNASNNVDTDVVDFVNETAPAVNEVTPVETFNWTELDRLIATEALVKLCESKGYAKPLYRCCRIQKTHRFQSNVTVNNANYTTYPTEFETELDARIGAARVAYEQIKENDLSVKYDVCADSFADLAQKLHDCIPSQNGVFQTSIPEYFEQMYKQSLPENWTDVIDNYPRLLRSEDDIRDKIVFKVTDDEPYTPAISITRTISQVFEPEELVLPWNEQHWNVFITNPVSTAQVWCRLIGDTYSGAMDTMLTNIEMDLLNNEIVAECICVNRIYLVMDLNCWYRVRIESIAEESQIALCFCIDTGEEEWRPLNQIYECNDRFISFPAQAICLTLDGLEDFAENPNAKAQVDQLMGRSLVAEILTTRDDYVANMETNGVRACIQTVLFDTTTDADINMNESIVDNICREIQPPQLKRDGFNTVNIVHVSDAGDIYCHLAGSQTQRNLQFINKITLQLTGSANIDYNKYRCKSSNAGDRVLICDVQGGNKWYRAIIQPSQAPPNVTTKQCFCIDHGMTKTIDRQHIYRLNEMSRALYLFPPQAIMVRLDGIDNFNETGIARLRGLLSTTSKTLLQVVGLNTPPLVVLIKRTRLAASEETALCKINETIRMEQMLENSSDLMFDADDSFNSSTDSVPKVVKPTKRKILEFPRYNVKLATKSEYFNCVVAFAPNPNNFRVRPFDCEKEFLGMMMDLQTYCRNSNERVTEQDARKGEYFAGLHNDATWYRVIIQHVTSSEQICVYNCDYGDIAMFTLDHLRPLDERFLALPQLAIKAKLYNVQPKNTDWTDNDCSRFQDLTVGKQFVSQIKNVKTEQNNYEVELILIDTSTDEDIYIDQILVNEERAKWLKVGGAA